MRPAKIPLPKACIFCGQKGSLTREDFFPNWFREIFPRPAGFEKQRLGAQASWHEIDPDGNVVLRVGASHLARPGDLADQTLRVVCSPCNNGWMSRLQQAAKPVLLPYVTGRWRYPETTARRLMASWATMFAMVTEFCDEQSSAIPALERLVFSRDQQPLIGSCVWAGRLSGDLPYWFHHRALRLAVDLQEITGPPNAQVTTITLGSLFLQVFTTTSDLSAFDPLARAEMHGLALVWPARRRPLKTTPLPLRTGEQARDLAYTHLSPYVFPGISTGLAKRGAD